ncbi:PepSY domain-containing protein [Niallia sp. 01092]|uniref:PepSY domain-containing protein n=1 Tax=unclassified Niallia TaxID=2837522 RepID=UPI003FCF16B9
MRTRSWLKLLVFLVAAFILYIFFTFLKKDDLLSKDEVKEIISSKYEGDVMGLSKKKQQGREVYEAKIENNKGSYHISVDAKTGKIANIVVLSKKYTNNQSLLTERDAVKQVQKKYDGEIIAVQAITENGIRYFQISLKSEKDPYKILVNRQSKEIIPVNNEATGRIKEEAAKDIALKKIEGKIISIDLEEEDDQFVYEVEIETEKKEEVKLYINAYSGDVISINWEDD